MNTDESPKPFTVLTVVCNKLDEVEHSKEDEANIEYEVNESATVLECNIYRLHDHVIDLTDNVASLAKVGDHRGLTKWTDLDKRWKLICDELELANCKKN